MGGHSLVASPCSGGCGRCPARRRLLPGCCQRHEHAFAPLLAKKQRGPGTACALPCPHPGGGRAPGGSQRLCSSAGSPGCFAAETLSRPAPHGPCSPQGGECGQGRAEALYRGAATAKRLRRLNPLPQGRISGALALVSAPPKSAEPTWCPCKRSCSHSGHFTPNACKARCVHEIKLRCFYACFSTRITGSISVHTVSIPLHRH